MTVNRERYWALGWESESATYDEDAQTIRDRWDQGCRLRDAAPGNTVLPLHI